MISNDKLTYIIKDCELAGHKVKIKDISYVLLCRCYDDIAVAYKVLFDSDKSNAEILEYHQSNTISFLRTYMDSNFASQAKETKPKSKKHSKEDDITFEENKAYMLKLKRDTEKAMEDGTVEFDKGVTLLKDITTKLNDKFQVQNEVKEQMVIVNCKYDDICPKCSCEISRRPISKEEAIEMYGLVEKM